MDFNNLKFLAGIVFMLSQITGACPQSILSFANAVSAGPQATPVASLDPHASQSLNFGVVFGVSIRLIKPIAINGETFYVLNTVDTDVVVGTKHHVLGQIFRQNGETDEMHRSVVIKNYKITLLNTPELIALRQALGVHVPASWNMSSANLASATAVSDTDHHNVSLTSDQIFTDGGGVYDGIAIVRVQRTTAPSTPMHQNFVITPAHKLPAITAQSTVRKNFSPNDPLDCSLNVNCISREEVVAKMRARWLSFSSKTVFSNQCLAAISRIEGWQVWNFWSNEQRTGAAQVQMSVCNQK